MKNLKKIKLHTTHIVVMLLLTTTLGSIGVGLLVQTNPILKSFDFYLYQVIHNGPNYFWLDFLIKPFNYNFLPPELSPGRLPSYYYFMMLITLVYLAIFKRSLLIWAVFAFIFGTILAYFITALDWKFVFRNRPFLELPSEVDEVGKQAWQKLSSFPSGHARETALYATIMAGFIPRLKWALIIFTLFIGYSRIYLGAHYPTDVIAGLLIGLLTGIATLLVSRELQIMIE